MPMHRHQHLCLAVAVLLLAIPEAFTAQTSRGTRGGQPAGTARGTAPARGAAPAATPIVPVDPLPIRYIGGRRFKYVVKADGSVIGWGPEEGGLAAREPSVSGRVTEPVPIALPAPVRQVVSGSNMSYALLDGGTVVAWGMNDSGQFGSGAGSFRTPANPLRSWVPVSVPGLVDVVEISAAGEHALAVLADGSVMTWGSGPNVSARDGMLKVPGLTDVIHAAAAGQHDLFLTREGQVFGWGANAGGQLGHPLDVRRIERPAAVAGLPRIVSIGASSTTNFGFSVALDADGRVWTWGSNQSATMGHGTFWGGPTGPDAVNDYPVPAIVNGISNARSLAVGDGHVGVVLADRSLRLWGHDGWGQLGVGTSGFYSEVPKRPALTDVAALYLVGSASFAVRVDGSFYWWGVAATYGGGPFAENRKVPTAVLLP